MLWWIAIFQRRLDMENRSDLGVNVEDGVL
jgi:hypothetical protein